LKEAVQDFTDHTLQLSDSPYDHKYSASSPSSSGLERGHSTPYFSSIGNRSHRGFGLGPSEELNHGSYSNNNHSDSSSSNVSSTRHSDNHSSGSNVDEPLVPAIIYIAVAGLTGSILARKSKDSFFQVHFHFFFLKKKNALKET
jgi:hypothetical protein